MRVDVGLRFTGGALAGLRQDLLAVLNDTRKEQCEKGAADDDVGTRGDVHHDYGYRIFVLGPHGAVVWHSVVQNEMPAATTTCIFSPRANLHLCDHISRPRDHASRLLIPTPFSPCTEEGRVQAFLIALKCATQGSKKSARKSRRGLGRLRLMTDTVTKRSPARDG